MKNILCVLTAISISATGCAKPSATSSAISEVSQASGKNSGGDYRAFLYQQTGECDSPTEIHHYPSSGEVKIGVTKEGKNILASIRLFMRQDGTYLAHYQESVVHGYLEDGYSIDSRREKIVRGQWTMNDVRLTFSDLGQALAIQYNGMPAMRLKMESNILSQGFKGQALLLPIVASTFNPITEIDPCSLK